MGKRGGHRVPKEVTRERERRAWELRQKLWTQARIGVELGVTESTICKMLKRVSARYLSTLNESVGERKAEQVAQLATIADEAFQAWESSKKPAKGVNKRVRRGRAPFGGSSEETSTAVKEREGDPRYLNLVMDAMADIRKIMGLDAPDKHEVSGKSGGPIRQKVEYVHTADNAAEILAILEDAGVIPTVSGGKHPA